MFFRGGGTYCAVLFFIKKVNYVNEIKLTTRVIENAFLTVPEQEKFLKEQSPEFRAQISEHCNLRMVTIFFEVDVVRPDEKKKTVYVALVGGELDDDGDIKVTEMGGFTMAVSNRIIEHGFGESLTLYPITCTCGKGRMRAKVHAVLAGSPDKTVILFVGDIRKTCDGKILPHLNWNGAKMQIDWGD